MHSPTVPFPLHFSCGQSYSTLVRIHQKPNQRRWASVARPGSSVAGTRRTAEANLNTEGGIDLETGMLGAGFPRG